MGDVAALTWPLTRPGGLQYVPNRRVRRCLFGPVDHEKLASHLEEERVKRAEEDKQRWNFDFQAGRPLPPGRYLWKSVGDPSDADSNGESSMKGDDKKTVEHEQTLITDFMRKRKSSNQKDKDPDTTLPRKIRRRSSTKKSS